MSRNLVSFSMSEIVLRLLLVRGDVRCLDMTDFSLLLMLVLFLSWQSGSRSC